jgi:hypothetical protein
MCFVQRNHKHCGTLGGGGSIFPICLGARLFEFAGQQWQCAASESQIFNT